MHLSVYGLEKRLGSGYAMVTTVVDLLILTKLAQTREDSPSIRLRRLRVSHSALFTQRGQNPRLLQRLGDLQNLVLADAAGDGDRHPVLHPGQKIVAQAIGDQVGCLTAHGDLGLLTWGGLSYSL